EDLRRSTPPLWCGDVVHAHLEVIKDKSSWGHIWVSVWNGSDGRVSHLKLKSIDTIGKLKKKFLKMNPSMHGSLNLAYNGKPVPAEKSLGELNVKSGSKFVIFQRCPGG
uniref:Ubiquitin-like domain-containing protein n=1 Tax=Denticeps clupeoides TaxID=299321 RepID=A0AAY4AA93_9TELE